MDLCLIDLIITAIIVLSAIYGAFKGFIAQLTSIVSLLLGVWCAFKFSTILAEEMGELFSMGESAVYIISFIIILVIVIFLANIIGRGIEKIIQFALLGWLNRLLGILFTTAKFLILLSLVVYLINYMNSNITTVIPQEYLNESRFYPALTELSQNIFPYLQKFF